MKAARSPAPALHCCPRAAGGHGAGRNADPRRPRHRRRLRRRPGRSRPWWWTRAGSSPSSRLSRAGAGRPGHRSFAGHAAAGPVRHARAPHRASTARRSEIDDYKLNEADVAIDSVVYAQRTLLAGFTTVRDLGDEYRASIALRNAINAGKVPGPRIIAAGKAIATTGGHADPTNGWARKFPADPGPDDGVINSVEDARKAVQAALQGRLGHHQDHGHRRRVVDRQERRQPADDRRGDPRGGHDGARLRLQGCSARARRGRHQARRARRRRHHRARHLHG